MTLIGKLIPTGKNMAVRDFYSGLLRLLSISGAPDQAYISCLSLGLLLQIIDLKTKTKLIGVDSRGISKSNGRIKGLTIEGMASDIDLLIGEYVLIILLMGFSLRYSLWHEHCPLV